MKSEIIENEIRKIVNGTGKVFPNSVSEEMAFNYLTLPMRRVMALMRTASTSSLKNI